MKYTFLYMAILWGTFSAHAQEPAPKSVQEKGTQEVTVHTFIQKGRLNEDLTGGYGRLLKYVQSKLDHKTIIKPNYLARSLRSFDKLEQSCFFPMGYDSIHKFLPNYQSSDFVYSHSVDIVSGHVFNRKGKKIIRAAKDMQGLKFSGLRKVMFKDYFPLLKEDQIIRVPTGDHNVRLMTKGRVDYTISFMPDAAIMFKLEKFSDYTYDPKFKYLETTTHFGCKKAKLPENYMQKINDIILDLQMQNKLQKILSPYAQPANKDTKPYVRRFPL